MARLSRVAVAVAALCGCGAALADPITLLAALAPAIGGTAAAFAVTAIGFLATYGLAVATVGFGLLSSNKAKRKQAAAAAAQRSQYNASLQDRNVTGLSAEAPWQVVYGNPAPIGGSLVALLSVTTPQLNLSSLSPAIAALLQNMQLVGRFDLKYMVVVFAAHSCQSIDEIYFDGEALGVLDAAGGATVAPFGSIITNTISESLYFDASGLATPSKIPVAVTSAVGTVRREASSDVDGNYIPAEFIEGVYTVAIAAGKLSIVSRPAGTDIGFPVTVTYTYTSTGAYVNVQKHLGATVDVADAYLIAAAPGQWTATDKLTGYTYAVVTLNQNLDRFKGGPPNISARITGKKIYDFRTGLTAYSRNPALCLADFIMSEPGYGATIAQFDVPSVIAAANACDAQGFYCDGAFKTEQDRESTKQQLEDSFGGTCHQSGGVWRISAGAWSTPVMPLTDADLAAPIQITQASYTSKERFNTVRGKYVSGTGLGVATDFTPWQNPVYVASDGLVKVQDITLPFTNDHQRAQNLARMLVERSRGGLTITYPGQMRLWPLQPGDRVSITNAEFGWAAKTFRVTDWGFHPRTPVALTMVEDVAVYYDAAAVITEDAAPNTGLPNPFVVPDLLGLTALSGTDQLLLQDDGTVIVRVLWAWTKATNTYVLSGGYVQRQWRLASSATDAWNTLADEPGDSTSAYQTEVPDGVTVLLRARFFNQQQVGGNWTVITHFVVGKTAPPANVATVACVFETSGLRVNWSAVADRDLSVYELRKGGTSWGTSTFVARVKGTNYLLSHQLAGVVTAWVKAVDLSGNYSLAAGSGSITVLAPAAPILTKSSTEFNRLNLQWLDAKTSQPIRGYFFESARILLGVEQGRELKGGAGADSRSDSIPYTEAGDYKFYIYAVDVAGNVGASTSFNFTIKLPNDFKGLLNVNSTFTGTVVNAVKLQGPNKRVRMLVNATETWGQHFSSRGWTNIAAQIAAGYPLFGQPGTTTASYTEQFDIGKIFPVATLNVTLVTAVLAGAPTALVTLGWSADNVTWFNGSAGVTSLAMTNVRYVRVVVNAASANLLGLLELVSLQAAVSVQRVSENTGVLNLLATDVSGTLFTTTAAFSDVTDCQMTEAETATSTRAFLSYTVDDLNAPTTPAKVYFYAVNAAGTRINCKISANIQGV